MGEKSLSTELMRLWLMGGLLVAAALGWSLWRLSHGLWFMRDATLWGAALVLFWGWGALMIRTRIQKQNREMTIWVRRALSGECQTEDLKALMPPFQHMGKILYQALRQHDRDQQLRRVRLTEMRVLIRAVLERVEYAVLVLGADGEIQYANARAARRCGMESASVMEGMRLAQLSDPPFSGPDEARKEAWNQGEGGQPILDRHGNRSRYLVWLED